MSWSVREQAEREHGQDLATLLDDTYPPAGLATVTVLEIQLTLDW